MYEGKGTNKDNTTAALGDALKALRKKVEEDTDYPAHNPGAWFVAHIYLEKADSSGRINWKYKAEGEVGRPRRRPSKFRLVPSRCR